MHEGRPINFAGKPLPGKLQFSLSTLLLLMTLACVCLALIVRLPMVGAPLAVLTAITSVRAFAGARYDLRLRNAALVPMIFAEHFIMSFALIFTFTLICLFLVLPVTLNAFALFDLLGMRITPLGKVLTVGLAILASFGLLLRVSWPPI